MNREEKKTEVEFLGKALHGAQVALCADPRGLTVMEVTELRKQLFKAGSGARVVKNSLARIAAKDAFTKRGGKDGEIKKFVDVLHGPNMLVYSDADPVAPARVISGFAKDHQNLKIKGGWVDGTFIDSAGVETLSKMPGREETLARLLALIAAPATQLVRLLAAPGTQVVRALEAHRANLEKKGA
ncbi:MAG: 50S ribosomal protein L10 [Oligoflexia bacterium]|nr:50S ribosomal protein L10 [Oligoflexia bacterium]